MRRAPLFFLAFVFAACAGSGGTNRPDDRPVEPVDEGFPAYETFDPSGYDAPPPRAPQTVQHDVPGRLMEGRVDVPATSLGERTVDGFRIQVFSGEDRRVAEDIRGQADAWARDIRGQNGVPRNMETNVAFQRPYYRVRIGAFEFRDDAEGALGLVRGRFPEAFIVPDRVTVRD